MLIMTKRMNGINEQYVIWYGEYDNPRARIIEFTTYDLIHFMRWLYEMYDRKLVKPMHISETSDGHFVLFEQVEMEDYSYHNKSYLIHRTYNKLKDVEEIIDIFNKYY